MKTTDKGAQFEREVKATLELDGWKVHRQHKKAVYIKDKKTGRMRLIMIGADIFGCDMVAKRHGFRPLWVQVSTPDNKSAKIKQVMEHVWDFEKECVQLWLRIPGKRAYRVFEAPTFEELQTRTVAG